MDLLENITTAEKKMTEKNTGLQESIEIGWENWEFSSNYEFAWENC